MNDKKLYYVAIGNICDVMGKKKKKKKKKKNICDGEVWRTKLSHTVLTESKIPFSVVLSV